MLYTIEEYAKEIAKCCSKTVRTRIRNGFLPTNHIVKKGKQWMIEVIEKKEDSFGNDYFNAAVDYHAKKNTSSKFNDNYELAAGICIEYNLSATKFFKMVGL
jgi:hypothetical protein